MPTVYDAANLWCPFARQDRTLKGPVNRQFNGEPSDGSFCIGDRCMAWRWNSPRDLAREHVAPKDRGATWSPGSGGCGMVPHARDE